jgi:hypothetical protein
VAFARGQRAETGHGDAWRLCDAADTTRRFKSFQQAVHISLAADSPPPIHLPPCPPPPGLAAAHYTHTHAHALHTPRYSRPLSQSSLRLSADHRSAIIELHLRRRLPLSRALPTNFPPLRHRPPSADLAQPQCPYRLLHAHSHRHHDCEACSLCRVDTHLPATVKHGRRR